MDRSRWAFALLNVLSGPRERERWACVKGVFLPVLRPKIWSIVHTSSESESWEWVVSCSCRCLAHNDIGSQWVCGHRLLTSAIHSSIILSISASILAFINSSHRFLRLFFHCNPFIHFFKSKPISMITLSSLQVSQWVNEWVSGEVGVCTVRIFIVIRWFSP